MGEQVMSENVTQPQGQNQPAANPPAPAADPMVTSSVMPTVPVDDPLPQGMTRGSDGKVQVLSTSAFKRLKDEARERGKKEALEATAKEHGFKSVDDMLTALKPKPQSSSSQEQGHEAPQGNKPNGQKPNGESRSMRAMIRDREQLQQERDQLKQKYERESTRRRDLQESMDAREAEMTLRESAIKIGVTDVDYALRLLTRSLEGKPEEELAKFDEAKFFEGLRSSHPYLFKEVTRPANTGTGAGTAPAGLKPEEAAQAAASNGRTDARNMKSEEYKKLLAARGLQINI